MENYKKVLELLEKEYGWNLFDSITNTGKRLVLDTLKANQKITKNCFKEKYDLNFFEKLPLYLRFLIYFFSGFFLGVISVVF